MQGTIDHTGHATIAFNVQFERLEGPGGKFYLPCSDCGAVELVNENVIGIVCSVCEESYR